MANSDVLTRLRYKYFSGRLIGEILSKSWIDSAIPVAALAVVLVLVALRSLRRSADREDVADGTPAH